MATTSIPHQRSKVLHISLWIAQIILGGMFLMAGFMKAFTPIEALSATLPFAKDMVGLIRFIGVSEILGGLGIIAPAALRIAPQLTVWAAYGLAAIMIFAVIFHISRNEFAALPTPLVLGSFAIFVAWGRSVKAPIFRRG
jgi:putative oxidoreductase